MTLYAFSPDGVVLNLLPSQPSAVIDGKVVHAGPTLTPVSDTAQVGWLVAADGTVSAPPLLPVDLRAYAVQAQAALLAAGQTFNVAAAAQPAAPVLCDGTSSTRADLALLALYGQNDPSGSKTWIDNAGKVTVLTGAQLVMLATLAGTWVSDTYAALASVVAGVAAGRIKTTAEIDAAFAAIPV